MPKKMVFGFQSNMMPKLKEKYVQKKHNTTTYMLQKEIKLFISEFPELNLHERKKSDRV